MLYHKPMGYYDIFNLFENEDWERHSSRQGDELVFEPSHPLICPACLSPLERAAFLDEDRVLCGLCGCEIGLCR